jgi:hypothetical protein
MSTQRRQASEVNKWMSNIPGDNKGFEQARKTFQKGENKGNNSKSKGGKRGK